MRHTPTDRGSTIDKTGFRGDANPRRWGPTLSIGRTSGQLLANPTRLGIDLRPQKAFPLLLHTPHAIGDQPLDRTTLDSTWGRPHAIGDQPILATTGSDPCQHTPRDWGSTLMEKTFKVALQAHPTRLGINRIQRTAFAAEVRTPHAIGDQPSRRGGNLSYLRHTPQDWGSTYMSGSICQMGVTYPTRLGINLAPGPHQSHAADTPHAIGDQP